MAQIAKLQIFQPSFPLDIFLQLMQLLQIFIFLILVVPFSVLFEANIFVQDIC